MDRWSCCSRWAGFPRLHGRGLIEAETSAAARPPVRRFHDCMVVASLKLQPRVKPMSAVFRFHDCMVVASLKHSARLGLHLGRLGFHDCMVVASLKLSRPARQCRGPQRFPRLHGRGLIEATTPRRSGSRPAGFHDCMVVASWTPLAGPGRGLRALVGFHDCMVVASLKQLSTTNQHGRAAKFPRLHGRGLIEADPVRWCPDAPRCFHDCMVVASLKPGPAV